MTSLTDKVLAVLAEHGPVSREDASTAIEAIKQAERATRQGEALVSEGPCLECGTPITYRPSSIHKARGNAWFRKAVDKWRGTTRINIGRFSDVSYNGYNVETVDGYLCDECRAGLAEEASELLSDRRVRTAEQELAHIHALVAGTAPGTPYRVYSALASVVTPEDIDDLRAMPYRKFLQSRYWAIVRRYATYRQRVCQLCASPAGLNVHHKTYHRHGHEHEVDVLLKDLIVLCRACHAKFHDKLPQPPEDATP